MQRPILTLEMWLRWKYLMTLVLERGSFTILGCHNDNQKRIENSQQKSSDIYRGRRSELRDTKKREKDKNEVREGKTYGAGQFTSSKKKKGS